MNGTFFRLLPWKRDNFEDTVLEMRDVQEEIASVINTQEDFVFKILNYQDITLRERETDTDIVQEMGQ